VSDAREQPSAGRRGLGQTRNPPRGEVEAGCASGRGSREKATAPSIALERSLPERMRSSSFADQTVHGLPDPAMLPSPRSQGVYDARGDGCELRRGHVMPDRDMTRKFRMPGGASGGIFKGRLSGERCHWAPHAPGTEREDWRPGALALEHGFPCPGDPKGGREQWAVVTGPVEVIPVLGRVTSSGRLLLAAGTLAVGPDWFRLIPRRKKDR
jgi:hypothetical protein